MRPPLLLCCTCCLLASPLAAQRVVRWTSQGTRHQAEVFAVDSLGLLVVSPSQGSQPLTIDPDTIPGLSERVGGSHSRASNALIGTLLGGALGAGIGYASGDDRCGEGWFGCLFVFTAGQKAAIGALLGAPLGLLIGAVALKAERWVPFYRATVASRVRPVVAVGQGGRPQLGVRIAF